MDYFAESKNKEEAKERYKFLTFAFHPDRFPDQLKASANVEMQIINVEYERITKAADYNSFTARQRYGKPTYKSYGNPKYDGVFNDAPNGRSETKPSRANPVRIKAKFSSFCAECYEPIDEGEECMWIGTGTVVHEDCLL